MCAAAPSLRVFFRRYLGSSFASRAYKSTRGETTGTGLPRGTQDTAKDSVHGPDKSITVVRSTSVTFGQDDVSDKKVAAAAGSLDAIDESESEGRHNWSPTPSKECLTRYSHEDDSIAMRNLAWSDPGHTQQRQQSGWL